MKNFLLLFFLISLQLTAQITHVQWSMESKKVSSCEYDLIFKAKIDKHWHIFSIHQLDPAGPNATSFSFTPNADYTLLGKMKEPKPHKEYEKVFEMDVLTHEKAAEFIQRIKLLANKKIVVQGKYEAQQCDSTECIFPPSDTFRFELEGSTDCAGSTVAQIDTSSHQAGLGLGTTEAGTTNDSTKKQAVISQASTKTSSECNPFETLLLGLGFGLGAVLMPCIYSLIPLTVSFFLKQSGSRIKGIKNALLYGIFIILAFVVLTMGITVIFGPTALSNIATNTGLNLFFFALFVVFALSFFGLFEITLPSSWATKLDAKADKGGTIGIFFMALTLVVVSFSCTVGFMGGLITAVARGEGYLCPLMGFTGFGAGIALPFMLFAGFPSWLKSLPKSGGWMTTFKVTIAFLELALAVKFLANADNVNEWGLITREVFISLWIGIFGMLTFYLLGVFRTSHDDPPAHLSIGRILWATFFMSFTIYMIPGLWGAPLRIISSFPPPHHYAESPNGIGAHGPVQLESTNRSGDNSAVAQLEKLRVVGPDGLMLFKNDYDHAREYAKLVKKPLFIDFTGNACVNCRLMENNVWSKPEVLQILKEKVVIVSLYVDSKVPLPKEEQKEVFWYGKNRLLETIGDKWAFLQTTKYNTSSQPQYVVLDDDENTISNGIKGTELNAKVFADWLQTGVNAYQLGSK
jgi:thiol:disulfide interchange protein